MRIDNKTVRGRKYLQFVNSRGDIFHIGSSSDFDSWLISAIVWDNEWKKEYYKKRNKFFDLFVSEMSKNTQLDDTKRAAFNQIRFSNVAPSSAQGRPLRVPKTHLFGQMERNEDVNQQRWRPLRWRLNEWGIRVQNRLNDINSKQRVFQKRRPFSLFIKEQELKINRELESYTQENVKQENIILSIVKAAENKRGFARRKELIEEMLLKYKIPQEEANNIIETLLRKGKIFEPSDGHFKIT